MARVGDPGFRAVEDVAAPYLLGLQLHRHDVAARAGFGHGEAADMLAADQFREIFRLLFIIAPAADLVDAEVRVGTIAEADRRRIAPYLLERTDTFPISVHEPHPFLINAPAYKTEFAPRPPNFITSNRSLSNAAT